jgi:hypothetical protein
MALVLRKVPERLENDPGGRMASYEPCGTVFRGRQFFLPGKGEIPDGLQTLWEAW